MGESRAALHGTGHERLASLFAIVLTPVLAIACAFAVMSYLEQVRLLEHEAMRSACSLAQILDGALATRQTRLEVLALSPHLQAGDLVSFQQQSAAVIAEGGAIALIGGDGRQLMNSSLAGDLTVPRMAALGLVSRSIGSSSATVSNIFTGPAELGPMFAVAMPIHLPAWAGYRSGANAALLYGQPVRALQDVLAVQQLPVGYAAVLRDGSGTLIAHRGSDAALIARGDQRVQAALSSQAQGKLHGEGHLLSYCRLVRSGWSVVLRVERSAILANMQREMAALAAVVAAALAIGAFMVWRFNRTTVHALDGLRMAAARAAKGQLDARAPLEGPLEIAALAQQFNQMLAARETAERHLHLAASVFSAAAEGIMLANAELRIIDANPAFVAMSGYARDELLGKPTKLLQSGRHGPAFYEAMWQAIETLGHWQGQIWDRRRDGSLFAAYLTITRVHDSLGAVSHYIALFTDITVQRLQQEEIERAAHFDPLTQLPNRRLLADRLQQGLARARRCGGMLAVCALDLDGFKEVNDQQGHEAGDMVLVEIAQRLVRVVRANDTVARLGGDEFLLVLSDLDNAELAEEIVLRALHAVRQPVLLEAGSARVSASIGLALYPEHGHDADALLRASDCAMYVAKRRGRDQFSRAQP